jgi:hypothetical protein
MDDNDRRRRITDAIYTAWAGYSQVVDWKQLETTICHILQLGNAKPEEKLWLIDEAMAAFTKRGHSSRRPERPTEMSFQGKE